MIGDEAGEGSGRTRREVLATLAGAALVGPALGAGLLARGATTMSAGESKTTAAKGKIRHSLVHWCYAPYFDVPAMIGVARDLGVESLELIAPEHYPALKAAGLTCAIGSIDLGDDPPFTKGFNNPAHRDRVLKATTDAIDAASAHGVERVICFTGYADGISPEAGAANCVEGLKRAAEYASKKGVVLCLEMLNTRADDHPMKGHPGYQGNHTDYCMGIIDKVGSPHLKLLFDIYHVQIQDGDVIRRIRQLGDAIGHVHTAGVPGRGELDDNQEVNFPPIMRALQEIGYRGFVGHEFIPTRDALAGIKQAVALCTV